MQMYIPRILTGQFGQETAQMAERYEVILFGKERWMALNLGVRAKT